MPALFRPSETNSGSSAVSGESDDLTSRIIVVCISPNNKPNQGIEDLANYMREKLVAEGVIAANVYITQEINSDTKNGEANTEAHWREIKSHCKDQPILYIIGYDQGAWAAAQLAYKAIQEGATVKYVGLIDGFYSGMEPTPILGAEVVVNFYQQNGGRFEQDGKVRVNPLLRGLPYPNAHQNIRIASSHQFDADQVCVEVVEFVKNYVYELGKPTTFNILERPKKAYHDDMPSDAQVWSKISQDVVESIASVKAMHSPEASSFLRAKL